MLRRKIDTELYRWRGSHSHGPLIIAGARRVGKTTTVRELGKLYEHFVELDLERYGNHRAMLADSPDPQTLIDRIRDEFGRNSVVKDRTLILLDEILACPGVWATLEKLVGFRDCDVIATASLPGMVRDRVPDGVGYMEMGPLDFEEFLWARGISEAIIADAVWRIRARRPLDEEQMANAGKQMREYIAVGGMPQAVNVYIATNSIDEVHRVHGELITVFRGIAGIYADPGFRERLYECYESIPEQLASGDGRFFFSKIRTHDGRRSSYGAREYGPAIRWLMDSGFCIRCDVTDDTSTDGSGDLFKLYIADSGVLNSMYPRTAMRDILDPSSHVSETPGAENMLACMVARFGDGMLRYRRRSTEVDFLTYRGNDLVGIDIRSGNNPKSKALETLLSGGRIDRAVRFWDGNLSIGTNGVERYPLFSAGFLDTILGPVPMADSRRGGGARRLRRDRRPCDAIDPNVPA